MESGGFLLRFVFSSGSLTLRLKQRSSFKGTFQPWRRENGGGGNVRKLIRVAKIPCTHLPDSLGSLRVE